MSDLHQHNERSIAQAEPERYRGRPLLLVLEHYVLHAIGEPPSGGSAAVDELVMRVFGGDDWREATRQKFQLPPDELILAKWGNSKQAARDAGVDLDPVQFAKMFVDANIKL